MGEHLKQNLCTTPLQVGATYLDTWGRRRHIEGHVNMGYPRKDDPNRVYCSACHYDINTGIATDPRVRLVNLPPAEELAFWEAQLEFITMANNLIPDKLVQDGLDNMKLRISVLKKELETR